jgi:hypothetical protein
LNGAAERRDRIIRPVGDEKGDAEIEMLDIPFA